MTIFLNALPQGAVFEKDGHIFMKLVKLHSAVSLDSGEGVIFDFENEPLVTPLDAELVINWETPYKGGENHE